MLKENLIIDFRRDVRNEDLPSCLPSAVQKHNTLTLYRRCMDIETTSKR